MPSRSVAVAAERVRGAAPALPGSGRTPQCPRDALCDRSHPSAGAPHGYNPLSSGVSRSTNWNSEAAGIRCPTALRSWCRGVFTVRRVGPVGRGAAGWGAQEKPLAAGVRGRGLRMARPSIRRTQWSVLTLLSILILLLPTAAVAHPELTGDPQHDDDPAHQTDLDDRDASDALEAQDHQSAQIISDGPIGMKIKDMVVAGRGERPDRERNDGCLGAGTLRLHRHLQRAVRHR